MQSLLFLIASVICIVMSVQQAHAVRVEDQGIWKQLFGKPWIERDEPPRPTPKIAVDTSELVSVEDMACIKKQGYSSMFFSAHGPTGGFDYNFPTNYKNTKMLGFTFVQGIISPALSKYKTGADQMHIVGAHTYGPGSTPIYYTMWIKVDGNAPGWKSQSENREFILSMLQHGVDNHMALGVQTSAESWANVVGADWSVDSKYHLWYVSNDGKPDFSDFKPFGGWTKPSIKKFKSDTTVCGVNVGLTVTTVV